MKIKNSLTIITVLLVLMLTSGCNMFERLDKPTDTEDAKYKEQQALKNGDYATAITLLEARIPQLQGTEKTDAIQTLADAYLGQAGVNILDIASSFSSTSDTSTGNAVLVKTLSDINISYVETATDYYNQLILELDGQLPSQDSIKRTNSNSSNLDSKKKDIYMSAALANALLGAHYLAQVIYKFDEGEKIKIVISYDGTATAYDENDNVRPIRNPEEIRNQWIKETNSKATFGHKIIKHLFYAKTYFSKTLDDLKSNTSDMKQTMDDFYLKISKYDTVDINVLDSNFIDTINSFNPGN